jgi:hypothetical protein
MRKKPNVPEDKLMSLEMVEERIIKVLKYSQTALTLNQIWKLDSELFDRVDAGSIAEALRSLQRRDIVLREGIGWATEATYQLAINS